MTDPILVPRFVPSESETWRLAEGGGLTPAQFEAVRAIVASPAFAHMVSPDWTTAVGRQSRRGRVTVVFYLKDGRLRACRIGVGGRVLQTADSA